MPIKSSRGLTTREKLHSWLSSYLSKRMLAIFILGFSSGLPLALVGSTLQVWFKTSGASMLLIGFTSLIGQPYSYKYLWAPLMDKYSPGLGLDRRRAWILCMQVAVISFIILMSFFQPNAVLNIYKWQVPVLFILGLCLSFCSASQDIAIDAYRTAVLKQDERGLGSALAVEGYRLAMLASGGVAFMLAEQIGWQATYRCMAALMLLGIVATTFAPTVAESTEKPTGTLFAMIHQSFKDFFSRKQAALILLLMILYKLGDAFASSFSSTFLLDLQFSLTEVGLINKVLGMIASLIGIFLGGLLMTRIPLYRALLGFGALSTITHLSYMFLAILGKNFYVACIAVFLDSIAGGMGTAAFVALIMSLCNKKYTATQFALLSSLTSLGRVYVGPLAGYVIHSVGWVFFYGFASLVALPGLLLLIYLRPQIESCAQDIDAKPPSKLDRFKSFLGKVKKRLPLL